MLAALWPPISIKVAAGGFLQGFFRQELHVERARGQIRPVEALAHVSRDVIFVRGHD